MNKHLFFSVLFLSVYALAAAQSANTALSNLRRTAINRDLAPRAGSTLNLGNNGRAWNNLYLNGAVYLGNDVFLSAPMDNTFTGRGAGINNTGSGNTAHGLQALYSNSTGTNNTALGNASLVSNTSGGSNTSVGYQTLFANTTGYGNTAVGRLALGYITESSLNTGVGYAAGDLTTNYSNATLLGAYANTSENLFNVTAIGYEALTTASNTVTIGNTAVTEVNSTGDFVTTSDSRFKSDVKEEVPGLAFINQLHPVTYNYNIHKLNSYIKPALNSAAKTGLNGVAGESTLKPDDRATMAARVKEEASIKAKEAIKYSGFLAQEVQEAAKKVNYSFSGVHVPASDKDVYGLSYATFVVPLVKAVQELSKDNDAKEAKINDLQQQIDELKTTVSKLITSSTSGQQIIDGALLENNAPNPFRGTTRIFYTLPQRFSKADLKITDKSGKLIKVIPVSGAGRGSAQIYASTLSSGTYSYSLYVDGKLIATKEMLLAK